ncbi:MAG: transglycosylase domain-containing protein, partial [Hyphomicrobiales bacterium]|nr:transglycosylase domain-containing protein [Hyphomicrobiales bacterium]
VRWGLRKAVEIAMALAIDKLWGKRRTLEIYLNVAEWGDGTFGAEAAARRYFGRSASALTARQAALLAVALPNPFLRVPSRPRGLYARLVNLDMRRARDMGPWLDCLAPARRR